MTDTETAEPGAVTVLAAPEPTAAAPALDSAAEPPAPTAADPAAATTSEASSADSPDAAARLGRLRRCGLPDLHLGCDIGDEAAAAAGVDIGIVRKPLAAVTCPPGYFIGKDGLDEKYAAARAAIDDAVETALADVWLGARPGDREAGHAVAVASLDAADATAELAGATA